MRIDDPPPTISGDGTAITPRETGGTQLVSDDFSVLHVATVRVGRYWTEFSGIATSDNAIVGLKLRRSST
jgi:hypothetical protein